jgi:hypothetical protein
MEQKRDGGCILSIFIFNLLSLNHIFKINPYWIFRINILFRSKNEDEIQFSKVLQFGNSVRNDFIDKKDKEYGLKIIQTQDG